MPIAQLRIRYEDTFRRDPPAAFGPDLLRRCLAHRHQEKVCGGLSRAVQKMLDGMAKATMAKPNGRLEIPRQIKPGSELVRTWKGRTHRVLVTADGFAYAHKRYTSLSEIASQITGTKWNGPLFFGLRSKAEGAKANGK